MFRKKRILGIFPILLGIAVMVYCLININSISGPGFSFKGLLDAIGFLGGFWMIVQGVFKVKTGCWPRQVHW